MESEKPEQPKKPFGRSLSDFGVLKSGERKLLDACEKGVLLELGGAVPEVATDENCVRAEFLRFLLLGGDDQVPIHEGGVLLMGAYIEGALILRSCIIPASVMLKQCYVSGEINLQDARVFGVFGLTGSHLASNLEADRLQSTGAIFLRDGFKVKGSVTLRGARIDDSLDCNGGSFEFKTGIALNFGGANVKGDIFLRDSFLAQGEVSLLGAKIGGDLDCAGGRFEFEAGDALSADGAKIAGSVNLSRGFTAKGVVRLLAVHVGIDLNCSNGRFLVKEGTALNLEGAVVQGNCFFCELPESVRINVSHSDVAVLVDDLAAWADSSTLDGFRYGALGGRASTNADERIKWLLKSRSHLNAEGFRPQPWHQLQRVLREMGHTEDAKLVGIAYEKHQRKIGRVGQSAEGTNCIVSGWRRVTTRSAHFVFGLLAGFGYRPMRLVTWMLAVWLACGAAYWHLSLAPYRAIAPSAPLIFQDENYINCQPDQPGPPQPPANWYLCDELRSEYATFSPLAYSLDLMLPVVDLGQEKAWGAFIPAANAVWWKELFTHWAPGHVVRLITWFQILFGWVSSLLLVAIISGFARRNDES